MPLGEVAGMLEAPALRAEEERLRHVQCQRQRPHQALRPAVEGGRRNDEADADRGSSREAEDGLAEGGIVAARDQEQTDLGEADDAVRAREQQRVVSERARHTECDDQESSHRDEHHETDAALLRVEHARQPGVADPRPPQDAEDEQAPREPRPGRVVRHQRGALRDREDEDEVEEELERRDPLGLAEHRGDPRGTG